MHLVFSIGLINIGHDLYFYFLGRGLIQSSYYPKAETDGLTTTLSLVTNNVCLFSTKHN